MSVVVYYSLSVVPAIMVILETCEYAKPSYIPVPLHMTKTFMSAFIDHLPPPCPLSRGLLKIFKNWDGMGSKQSNVNDLNVKSVFESQFKHPAAWIIRVPHMISLLLFSHSPSHSLFST